MLKIKAALSALVLLSVTVLAACSTNPATGEQQFAALMSPGQEANVGATEHEKIVAQYGLVKDSGLNAYVNEVGRRVTANTERSDVQYKFFVIDSPIVNAFALPGGYIYVSRGLLALANSEAELAAVLAHETGHITGRHSAERYSTGVVTSLGASIISAAIGSQGASQALGLGSNLYLSSYSRGQESEADSLGLRYMSRGGYNVEAMPAFLYSMQQESALQAGLAGKKSTGASYFSTHPATGERVNATANEMAKYQKGGAINRETYLRAINGISYGDSEDQGFVRGNSFYHPALDFTFTVPQGFQLQNQPSQIVATNGNGSVVIFDMPGAQGTSDPLAALQAMVKQGTPGNAERIDVNGRSAATGVFSGEVNGRPMDIRLVMIDFGNRFARFQIAVPKGAPSALIEDMKRMTYSFRSMSAEDKRNARPLHLVTFTATASDSVAARAAQMPFSSGREERFRVMNGLRPGEGLKAGQMYKTVQG